MANRIPRTATKLEVEFLTDTSMGDKGIKVVAKKKDNGWTSKYNGNSYHLFLAHLRNENYCKIKVIA